VEGLARSMEHPIQGKTVLVVVAHPDDAEAFCGGTLAKLAQAENRVILAISTNGDRGSHDTGLCPTELVEIRRWEQHRAQEILGIRESIWLGYRDGQLSQSADFREQAAEAGKAAGCVYAEAFRKVFDSELYL
jgi:LmbE family N-acetylglucosaminyl deacetylase